MDSAQNASAVSPKREKPEHPAPKEVPVRLKQDPKAVLVRVRLKKRPVGLPVLSIDPEGEADEATGRICVDVENASVSMANVAALGLVLCDAYVKLASGGTGFCYLYLWYGHEERFQNAKAKEVASALAEEYSAATWKYVRIYANPGCVLCANLVGRLDNHPVQNKITISRKS